jgi:hypothetical protein
MNESHDTPLPGKNYDRRTVILGAGSVSATGIEGALAAGAPAQADAQGDIGQA